MILFFQFPYSYAHLSKSKQAVVHSSQLRYSPPSLKLPPFLYQQAIETPTPGGPSPHNLAQGFDAPPTLERSGSEHRRAVTSSRP